MKDVVTWLKLIAFGIMVLTLIGVCFYVDKVRFVQCVP